MYEYNGTVYDTVDQIVNSLPHFTLLPSNFVIQIRLYKDGQPTEHVAEMTKDHIEAWHSFYFEMLE